MNKERSFTSIFFWEFFGTSLLAYGIITSETNKFQISLSLFAAQIFTVCFTGAHLNPAVTLCCVVVGEIKSHKVFWTYILAEVLGAFFGEFFVWLLCDEVSSPYIHPQNIVSGIIDGLNEFLGTFLFVIFIMIKSHKETALLDNQILLIFTVPLALYFCRQLSEHTGGALNPAMAFSLSLFQSIEADNFDYFRFCYIFIVGELIGALCSGLFYVHVYVKHFNFLKKRQFLVEQQALKIIEQEEENLQSKES